MKFNQELSTFWNPLILLVTNIQVKHLIIQKSTLLINKNAYSTSPNAIVFLHKQHEKAKK